MENGAVDARSWYNERTVSLHLAPPISGIPEETLFEIFIHISRINASSILTLSLVNKEWRRISLDPLLIRQAYLAYFPDHSLTLSDIKEKGSVYILHDLISQIHQVMEECLNLPFRQDFDLSKDISAIFFKRLHLVGEHYNLNIVFTKIISDLIKDNPFDFKQTNIIKDALQEVSLKFERVDLNHLHLSALPTEISYFTRLTNLAISNNMLIRLPTVITTLISLNYLNVSKNRLKKLPDEIGKLSSLTSLKLSGNQLTHLPHEIQQLSILQFLSLKNNRFTNFPLEICELKKLNMLKFNRNQLSSLPSKIEQLQELEFLIIARNRLTRLPSEIGKLPLIFRINFKLNQIRSIPLSIKTLRSLGPGTSKAINQLPTEQEV